MEDIFKARSERILSIYREDQVEEMMLEKANNLLEKGGKRAVIGEKREFGGRMYIKTAQGWKFYGKGGGKKAQEHSSSTSSNSSSHNKSQEVKEVKVEKTPSPNPTSNENKVNYTSVDNALRTRSHGNFVNSEGEKCSVSYSYSGTTKIFRVTFSKPGQETASRPGIRTTSEKKILNLLNGEQFRREGEEAPSPEKKNNKSKLTNKEIPNAVSGYIKHMIGKDYEVGEFSKRTNSVTLEIEGGGNYNSPALLELERLGDKGRLWTVESGGANKVALRLSDGFYDGVERLQKEGLVSSGEQSTSQSKAKSEVSEAKSNREVEGVPILDHNPKYYMDDNSKKAQKYFQEANRLENSVFGEYFFKDKEYQKIVDNWNGKDLQGLKNTMYEHIAKKKEGYDKDSVEHVVNVMTWRACFSKVYRNRGKKWDEM